MLRLIVLPERDRPLPKPADLDRLMQCRYAVMIVCGRSGSSLVHSHLDGHRQVAHIPALCKFHDFLAVAHGLLHRDPRDLARALAAFPAYDYLFDTRQSATLAGQLGADGDAAILIDRGAFQDAMASALGGPAVDPRRALYAAVLAYEWCLGRDVGEARVVLHHLHHGDWLWPNLLVNSFNLAGPALRADLRAALKPDLLLIPVRAPMDVVRSYPAIAAGVIKDGAGQVAFYERLMRLLPQDWLRARVAAASDIPTAGIRLEDIKADQAGTFAALCGLFGIDAADPALAAQTFYGHPWTEDTWRAARKRAVAADPGIDRATCWQDRAFAMGALAGLADDVYPADGGQVDRNGVVDQLLRAAEDPPATLHAGLRATPEGRAAAVDRAWERVSFADRFWQIADAQKLGSLRLCRPAPHSKDRTA